LLQGELSLFKNFFHYLLDEPSTRELDINDPITTSFRREIIYNKKFLRKIYEEWYQLIQNSILPGNNIVIELGSGGGFFEKIYPDVISSDILFCPYLKAIFDGLQLPFKNNSLDYLVLINVFHHLPDSNTFFQEATRCVKNGGKILLIEPWVSKFSKIIYKNFHHEFFDPDAESWNFESSGPLSGANGALPWIVFSRDKKIFLERYPEWIIENCTPIMPFRYLLSGGVSKRCLVPYWSYSFWKNLEKIFSSQFKSLSMFAMIVLSKTR